MNATPHFRVLAMCLPIFFFSAAYGQETHDSLVGSDIPGGPADSAGATIIVTSVPPDATVELTNDSAAYKGKTPFKAEGLAADTYCLKLTLQDYEPIADTCVVDSGSVLEKIYSFQRIAQTQASAAPAVSSAEKRKNSFFNARIVYGAIGAAGLIGGFIFDNAVSQKIMENDRTRDEFWDLDNGGSHAEYTALMQKNRDDAVTLSRVRNGCYVVSAVAIGCYFMVKF